MNNKSLEALGEQYFFLKEHYEDLKAKCEPGAQRKELKTRFDTSEENFEKAINLILDAGNTTVKSLTNKLKANTKKIKEALEEDEEAVAILETITIGVQLGGDLIALGRAA